VVNLDATAGTRGIWANKNPPDTIFTDRNILGPVPPHVFCDYRYLPFRDDVFSCVIFDPPHAARNKTYKKFHWTDPTHPAYYGWDITDRDLKIGLIKGSKEFYRVSRRLCLKWGEVDYRLDQIYAFFKPWIEVHRRLTHAGKQPCWWVTFVRDEGVV